MAIASIRYWFYVYNLPFGDTTIRIRWDQASNNWGTTLEATQADFESTGTFACACDKTITSTGWNFVDLNPQGVTLSGTLWVRLSDTQENYKTQKSCQFRTNDYADASLHPYLEIKTAKLYPFWKFGG